MRITTSVAVAVVLAAAIVPSPRPARAATFHLWEFTEIYSSADGAVQFIEMHDHSANEQYVSGYSVTATRPGQPAHVFTFPHDIPLEQGETTADRNLLIATPGFAALAGVTPDYEIPAGFLYAAGGTLDFAGLLTWDHGPLPGGTMSLTFGGGGGAPDPIAPATPTNFDGLSGAVPEPGSLMLFGIVAAGFIGRRGLRVASSSGPARQGRNRHPSSPAGSPAA